VSSGRALQDRGLQPPAEATRLPATPATRWYSVLGVRLSVTADDPAAVDLVDETYASFRSPPGSADGELALRLETMGDGAFLVSDSDGHERAWPTRAHAVGDLLSRFMLGLLTGVTVRGIYAIHAGAVEHHGRATLFSGRSGAGKTTLVLSLLERGFRLLSDELALVEPSTQRILPYRRSLHVRPGTRELIPGLRRVRKPSETDVGRAWTLTPDLLDEALPGCLAPAAPLTSVLLLDGIPDPDSPPAVTPIPAAVAALELLRATWAASVDFDAGLGRVTRLLEGVSCARLRIGELDATTDAVATWLEGDRG
jgi:hypothetical protein